jgi:hypothetical protein
MNSVTEATIPTLSGQEINKMAESGTGFSLVIFNSSKSCVKWVNNILKLALARIFHKLTCALACLLIPQEHLLQSAVITDTPLLHKIPCKTNILRDHHTNS